MRLQQIGLMLLFPFFACSAGEKNDSKEPEVKVTDADGDGVEAAEDCADDNASVFPGAEEVCDGVDNNCDHLVDVDDPALKDGSTFYGDADGDGAGDAAKEKVLCELADGWSENAEDCNDNDDNIVPGKMEDCNSIDDNCDGQIDEEVLNLYYSDDDFDGFGDVELFACDMPPAGSSIGGDCDDDNATVYPGADELCDGLDNNCNSTVDEGPVDQQTFFEDKDGDGYGDPSTNTLSCTAPSSSYTTDSSDCNDTDASIHPGQTEQCDGVDNNCDGAADEGVSMVGYLDLDGDGFGDPNSMVSGCTVSSNEVFNMLDCNDADDTIYTGATELCDGLDHDCDGIADNGC